MTNASGIKEKGIKARGIKAVPAQSEARRHRSDGGFALLIVLWTLVPLSLMFLTLAATGRSDTQSAAGLRSAATLEAAADGAVNTAIFEVLAQGDATLPRQVMQLPGAVVAVDFAGLSGLVNPNTASPQLLRALMNRLGVDDERARLIAGAVVDWRTQGQRPGPNGAKAPSYRAAGLDYGPPGAPFETMDELGLVLRMTPDLLQALTPYLSLYAYGDPDPLTASPPVRQALHDVGVFRTAGPLATQVIEITAAAVGAGDARATRRAVVRIGPSLNGRGWRVLTWNNR